MTTIFIAAAGAATVVFCFALGVLASLPFSRARPNRVPFPRPQPPGD